MMNRQIRGEKIIATVVCVAICGAIESQPVETANLSASRISFLTYSAGVDAHTLLTCNSLHYPAAAIKLSKRKNC